VDPVHNEKIDDVIMSEIRKSSLFVADFTDERPNVYYEAGFAFALNIPTIRVIKAGHEPHFDIRQYNHIVWKDEDDLRIQLIARLEAFES
jgi:nucleoside 2-deoxyribosyltransferase